MTLYQQFKKLNIDHSAIGLEQCDTYAPYFCTPKGAKVIGWAGVDGIHYCFVKGFGEMVFAVSPENLPGEYVHPIARSFEDMLSLLLSCGSMDAIEQAHMWDEAAFDGYVRENQPGKAQAAAMTVIRERLGVVPMEHPFAYIKELQEGFDYSRLKFPAEYYQQLEPVEEQPPEWKVVYEAGFWPRRGRGGKEIPVDRQFVWGGEIWHIPAIYLCREGLVIDFCIEVEPERIQSHIDKWDLLHAEEHSYTEVQQTQIQSEHPFNIGFRSSVIADGKQMREKCSYGDGWVPESCLTEEFRPELHVRWILEHYNFDLTRGWIIRRVSLPWADKRPRNIKSLNLTLEREMTEIPGAIFSAPAAGESVALTNPVTGQEHILTVREREAHEKDRSHFRNDDMEYPTHCVGLTYTIFPELQDFYLRDCDNGDSSRMKHPNPGGPISMGAVGVIGMIKSGSGHTYLHPDGTPAKARAFCSSLHFEPVKELELNIVFREKRVPDIEVQIM